MELIEHYFFPAIIKYILRKFIFWRISSIPLIEFKEKIPRPSPAVVSDPAQHGSPAHRTLPRRRPGDNAGGQHDCHAAGRLADPDRIGWYAYRNKIKGG